MYEIFHTFIYHYVGFC